MTIICIPYAGASSSIYWPWKTYKNHVCNIILYELPGRGVRFTDPYASEMQEVVNEIVDIICNLPQNEDYVLFGHSMGGAIIFQSAQTIKIKKLRDPTHLFISGRNAPNHVNESKGIYNLDDESFIIELKKYAGKIDHILANEELKNIYLSVLRADFRLIDTFKYDPNIILDCDITVLHGQFDETMQGKPHEWKYYTNGNCTSISFKGNHFFLVDYLPQIMDYILLKLSDYK